MGAAKFSSSSFIFPSVLLLLAAFWEDGAGSQPGRARGGFLGERSRQHTPGLQQEDKEGLCCPQTDLKTNFSPDWRFLSGFWVRKTSLPEFREILL